MAGDAGPSAASAPRPLTAAELEAAVRELDGQCPADVLDAALLAANDDLLLVLDGAGRKRFLHVAPGGRRARVAWTERRFPKDAFAATQTAHALRKQLAGARLVRAEPAAGERRFALRFAGGGGADGGSHGGGARRLEVELFGPRGLWALCDGDGRVLLLSRDVVTAVRTLRQGDVYAPPPPRDAEPRAGSGSVAAPAGAPEAAPRFSPPLLAAIDAHFTPFDLAAERERDAQALALAAQRGLQRARTKLQGLDEKLADAGRAASLRADADLLLAYAHTVPRGAASATFPDPLRDGEQRTIALDPALPPREQAQRLYERARRLDDGRAIAVARRAEAAEEVAALEVAAADVARAGDAEALGRARAVLQRLRLLPRAPAKTAAAPKDRKPKVPPEENYRRFVSAEGYPILVGRDNAQNDRLTLRTASGNDVWLHVGGGRTGSHVVVRLPKGKTASLESLLDAGALAVHFSKARGERLVEVVYTLRKHVRKPKGLPPGAVVPSQTKSLAVRADESRLKRLLDGAAGDAE